MNARLLHACLVLAGAVALAACTTTTTTTSTTVGSSGGPSSSSKDPADAERRAKVRLELAGMYLGRGQPTTALDEVTQALAASARAGLRAGAAGRRHRDDHPQDPR